MSLNWWPHMWSTQSLNEDTNSYNETHSLLFTLLWSVFITANSGRWRLWFNFTFSAGQVFFPFFITKADSSESIDSIPHVTIKVPTFYKHALDTWFVHLEAQFALRNITASSTKFYWAISALSSDVSNQLMQLIQDPGEDPYKTIKGCLISLNSLTNY